MARMSGASACMILANAVNRVEPAVRIEAARIGGGVLSAADNSADKRQVAHPLIQEFIAHVGVQPPAIRFQQVRPIRIGAEAERDGERAGAAGRDRGMNVKSGRAIRIGLALAGLPIPIPQKGDWVDAGIVWGRADAKTVADAVTAANANAAWVHQIDAAVSAVVRLIVRQDAARRPSKGNSRSLELRDLDWRCAMVFDPGFDANVFAVEGKRVTGQN